MLCRAKDAQYAWRKMDGVSIDGRRWKVDYATKVKPHRPVCDAISSVSSAPYVLKWQDFLGTICSAIW